MLSNKDKNPEAIPPVLALFQKRLEGDDALLALARRRFKEAGLGTEFYAETPAQLDHLLQFKPSQRTPATAHLARGINLLSDHGREMVCRFAGRFRNDVFGLVVHDQGDIATSLDNYITAIKKLARELAGIQACPYLYIEYAVGLSPEVFIGLFQGIQDLRQISCAIDIGHVGLWQARSAYAKGHPNTDICALDPHDSALPALIDHVQKATESALGAVIHVVRSLGPLGKPIHFHLHDGHPLSVLSLLGISDHVSFLEKASIPFHYKGRRHLDLMFGPAGLTKIVETALQQPGPGLVSFTLEIHPTDRAMPLGPYSDLFTHWRHKTNAEKMNHWLSVLIENQRLVQKILRDNVMAS